MDRYDKRWPIRRVIILFVLRFIFVTTSMLLTLGMLHTVGMRNNEVNALRVYAIIAVLINRRKLTPGSIFHWTAGSFEITTLLAQVICFARGNMHAKRCIYAQAWIMF